MQVKGRYRYWYGYWYYFLLATETENRLYLLENKQTETGRTKNQTENKTYRRLLWIIGERIISKLEEMF